MRASRSERVVFRPRTARRVIYPVGGLLVVTWVAGAIALPAGPTGFALADRVALVLLGLAVMYVLHRVADVRIECDEEGLTVVNVLRSRRLAWAEVVAVRLGAAEPWVVLDLADGTALPAMGIQGSDGDHARRQAAQLARMVEERGAAPS